MYKVSRKGTLVYSTHILEFCFVHIDRSLEPLFQLPVSLVLDESPELYTRTKLVVFISKVDEKDTLVKMETFVMSEFRGDDWT